MDEKLIPSHVYFARWFIRIRWASIIVLAVSNYVVKRFFNISVDEIAIYIIVIILILLNIAHSYLIKTIANKRNSNIILQIKNEIHFQIFSDFLLLTAVIHFSGGIENPLVIVYYLHIIVSSSIYPLKISYLHTFFAILCYFTLIFFEYTGILPHYHLQGFTSPELYLNKLYILSYCFVFTLIAIIIASLSNRIISKSIKSEETYVKTNLELEKKEKIQNEYVQRVTHDIKGHLAAILSCLEVIKSKIKGDLNEVQEEFVLRAYERTEILTHFVKNLLNLTQKKLLNKIEYEEFSIQALINKIKPAIQILAKDKNISFEDYIEPGTNLIIANPYAIEELLMNLLTNAIKYTPPGGRVNLNVRNRYENILFEVSDSGIGIPPEDLPFIFDEFFRAKNAPKDFKYGSGLGLSIAKQIVDNHKGKIWATSELDVWTKICFTIPKKPTFD
ncbi:MAG: HAMP domain-containing histidine kinase [Sphingobacteriales bacterium]|nr:HAMP domain-containing histidine kinase [Sphingobacteriales bacterium]